MSRSGSVFAVFGGIVFLLFYGASAGANPKNSACVTCHGSLGGNLAQPVSEWNGSIHQQNGITCDLCHGGNASIEVGNVTQLSGNEFAEVKSRAMSKSHGFIGKPSGQAMFEMCAKCHPDSVARYAGSIMGKAYLENKGGPSCVVCHHAHNNIIPAVPQVCAGCHKDTTGFTQIDPMNVTAATVNQLSQIRILMGTKKARGTRPSLAPPFPEELDSYQVGLLAFAAVGIIFLFGLVIFLILEKEK